MSALTPHIKALRAEAVALSDQAERFGEAKTDAQAGALMVLLAISTAKLSAAEALETEEREREEGMHG